MWAATGLRAGCKPIGAADKIGRNHTLGKEFTMSVAKETIRRIQHVLARKGYNPGVIDGIWGRTASSGPLHHALCLEIRSMPNHSTIPLFPGSRKRAD